MGIVITVTSGKGGVGKSTTLANLAVGMADEGKKVVYDKVFSDLVDTPILKNQLGDSAGVFGACML